MKDRGLAVALAVMVIVALTPVPGAGQTTSDSTPPPRASDGRPDLQGVWDFRTITPLQRPRGLGEKEVLTDEEAAELEAQAAGRKIFDRPPQAGNVGAYNDFWLDLGTNVTAPGRQTRRAARWPPADDRATTSSWPDRSPLLLVGSVRSRP